MELPDNAPFAPAFLRACGLLLEQGYCQLSEGLEGYSEDGAATGEDVIDLFDTDLSNMIGTAAGLLGLDPTPEQYGALCDLLREDNPDLFTARDEAR